MSAASHLHLKAKRADYVLYLSSNNPIAIVEAKDNNHEDAAKRIALFNLNADMVKENPDYVVRIIGSDVYRKDKPDYFISVSAKYPVIATTAQLLSTGADCKMTKLIVLDKMISSMTEFKQIIGCGTRIREKERASRQRQKAGLFKQIQRCCSQGAGSSFRQIRRHGNLRDGKDGSLKARSVP